MRRSRLQFRLRTILIGLTLFCLALGAQYWWKATRGWRSAFYAIATQSGLSREDQLLFLNALWLDEPQLNRQLGITGFHDESRNSFNQLLTMSWRSSYIETDGSKHRVFVSEAPWRCNSRLIVVTDNRYNVRHWIRAQCGGILKSAKIQTVNGSPQLAVVADTVGLHFSDESHGTYRFELRSNEIRPLPVEWDREYARYKWAQQIERLNAEAAAMSETDSIAREAALTKIPK